MNKLFLAAAAVVLVLAARSGVASDDHRRRAPQIEGVWLTEVTLRDCVSGDVAPVPNPIFPAINTFHKGGTMSEHGARFSPATRNSGQGIWQRTGRNTFKSRFLFQRFDANGFFIGMQDATRTSTLSDDGNSLSSTATTTITDANGVVLVRGCATEVGERVEL
jgi:hypothetical protein